MKLIKGAWFAKWQVITIVSGIIAAILAFWINIQYERDIWYPASYNADVMVLENNRGQSPNDAVFLPEGYEFRNNTYGFMVDVPGGMRILHAKEREGTGLAFAQEILLPGELFKVNFLALQQGSILQLTITENAQALPIAKVRQQRRQMQYEADVDCIESMPFGCTTVEDIYIETGVPLSFAGVDAYRDSVFGFDQTSQCINFVKSIYEYQLCFDESNPNNPDLETTQKLVMTILDTFRFID